MTRHDQDYLSSVPAAFFEWHENDKEVADARLQYQANNRDSRGWQSPEPVSSKEWTASDEPDEPKRRRHNKRFWLICLAIIAIILVGAGVGVGVGVGLGLAFVYLIFRFKHVS